MYPSPVPLLMKQPPKSKPSAATDTGPTTEQFFLAYF